MRVVITKYEKFEGKEQAWVNYSFLSDKGTTGKSIIAADKADEIGLSAGVVVPKDQLSELFVDDLKLFRVEYNDQGRIDSIDKE